MICDMQDMRDSGRVYWVDESLDCKPRNIYGVTKLSAEHLCRMYHEMFAIPVLVCAMSGRVETAESMA
jgi:UDP-glucose 4-epimerase